MKILTLEAQSFTQNFGVNLGKNFGVQVLMKGQSTLFISHRDGNIELSQELPEGIELAANLISGLTWDEYTSSPNKEEVLEESFSFQIRDREVTVDHILLLFACLVSQ